MMMPKYVMSVWENGDWFNVAVWESATGMHICGCNDPDLLTAINMAREQIALLTEPVADVTPAGD